MEAGIDGGGQPEVGVLPVPGSVPADPARSAADAALVAELRAANFAGRRYEQLRRQLAAYACHTLHAMICNGTLYARAAEIAWPIRLSAAQAELLRTSETERTQLVDDAVAIGLALFVQRGLVEGGWRSDGGANLASYCVNACIMASINVFRSWQKRARIALAEHPVGDPDATRDGIGPVAADPAELVAMYDAVRERLDSTPPRLRPVLARIALLGETQAQAAVATGHSARSVEGQMRRYRAQLRAEGVR